jgi:hypothetical protein
MVGISYLQKIVWLSQLIYIIFLCVIDKIINLTNFKGMAPPWIGCCFKLCPILLSERSLNTVRNPL